MNETNRKHHNRSRPYRQATAGTVNPRGDVSPNLAGEIAAIKRTVLLPERLQQDGGSVLAPLNRGVSGASPSSSPTPTRALPNLRTVCRPNIPLAHLLLLLLLPLAAADFHLGVHPAQHRGSQPPKLRLHHLLLHGPHSVVLVAIPNHEPPDSHHSHPIPTIIVTIMMLLLLMVLLLLLRCDSLVLILFLVVMVDLLVAPIHQPVVAAVVLQQT
jgi:hypothetical protein